MKRAIAGLIAAVLAGCASDADVEPASSITEAATDLRDAQGRVVAGADVTDAGGAVRIRVEARGLPQGVYAVHLHSAGVCNPPSFETAGPHWNPTGRQHGRDNPQGQHLGDLPNLLVGTDGVGSLEYRIDGAALSGRRGLLDDDGAAVVVHANPDDYRTDPSGNSGARIACGVLS